MNNAARTCADWLLSSLPCLLLSIPLTVALVFSSAFAAPFSAPKNAILIFTVAVLAAAALAFSSGLKAEKDELRITVAAAAYVAVTVVSAVLSPHRSMCIGSVVWAVCGLLLFSATRAALSGEGRARNIRNLQIALSAAAVLTALLTIAQFFGLSIQGGFLHFVRSNDRMRMYGTQGNPDFVAAFLAVALPAALGLAIAACRLRALCTLVPLLIAIAILLTGSRGGALAMAVGITVVAFLAMRSQPIVRVAVLAAVAASCVLGAGTHLNARTPWESLRGRVFIWQVSLGDGAARSVIGTGPGTFAFNYPLQLGRFFSEPSRAPLRPFAGNERHAQDDFVEVLHDTGLLGLASLLALLPFWFVAAIRKLRACHQEECPAISAVIASVAALCVAALFDFPMHRAETWALFWILMAVPLANPSFAQSPARHIAWPRKSAAVLVLAGGAYFAFAPLASSYQLAKGESEENDGRLESSLSAYHAALRWEPSSADAHFDLVRVIAKTGDYAGALRQSDIAVAFVNEPELHILRSRILVSAGRDIDAKSEIDSALRLFPYSQDLRDEAAGFSIPDTGPALPDSRAGQR